MASHTVPGTPGNRETKPPAASLPPDHTASAATGVETESEAVCRLAAQLAAEIDPHRKNLRVELDSSLERDLGFDSLARVELLARLEKARGVALSEEILTTADTLRDLARALGRGTARSKAAQEHQRIQAERDLQEIGRASWRGRL